MAASVVDIGSGLNPATLSIKLDGRALDAIFDADRNLVIYTTKPSGKITDTPLTDGRHTVTINAADWRGNKSSQTWSFVVNNSLPVNSPKAAPSARGSFRTNRVEGGGADAGGADVSGEAPPPPPN